MKTNEITKTALLTALALIFGYIESLLPPPIPLPGIKLGLANIAVVFALFVLGIKKAFFVMLLKVLISSLLWGGVSSLLYSAAGGILSLFAMYAFKKNFSIIGISILGAIIHNIGQLLAASLMLGTLSVFAYLPPLILSGIASGAAIGIAANIIIRRVFTFF